MRRACALLLAAAALSGAAQEAPRKPAVLLGYYPSWGAHPTAKEIRYERYTHLAHAFLQSDEEGNLKEDRAIPNRELTRLAHEKGVKVLISLGGAASARTFRKIVQDEAARKRYVAAVAKTVAESGYDGVDVDWEPTDSAEDRKGVPILIRALRASLPDGLLTMAAPPTDWYGRWWDVDALKDSLDLLNVMTYDFHGPWSSHAGHNAALQGAPDDEEDGAVLSVSASTAYWRTKRGWPPEKLNVGIPCYGRGFAVSRWNQKPERPAPHESIAVRDVAALLQDGWHRAWDPKVGVPTLLKEGVAELISYEDAESAALKGAWAREQGVRGLFFWNISQDWRDGDHDIGRAAGAAFRGK